MSLATISSEYSTNPAGVAVRQRQPSIAQTHVPVVFWLDRDTVASESLKISIQAQGWRFESITSPETFLAVSQFIAPSCLIIRTLTPCQRALDLQRRMALDLPWMPVIFMAGHADVATTVKAMKAGAFGFFIESSSQTALLDCIREAFEQSQSKLAAARDLRFLRERYATLSKREREVMLLVTAGLLNKQVGAELGISEITVKAHRGQAMQKMNAPSLADLVKMADKLQPLTKC